MGLTKLTYVKLNEILTKIDPTGKKIYGTESEELYKILNDNMKPGEIAEKVVSIFPVSKENKAELIKLIEEIYLAL